MISLRLTLKHLAHLQILSLCQAFPYFQVLNVLKYINHHLIYMIIIDTMLWFLNMNLSHTQKLVQILFGNK